MSDHDDSVQEEDRSFDDKGAVALAACYRLLIEKAAEHRRRNEKNIEPAQASNCEVEGGAAEDHDSR